MSAEGKLDPEKFRACLGRFATGVTVVTCGAGPERRAMTVNSFTSVSLDPPLILFCLGDDAFHKARFLTAESFAVSILSDDQMDLSNRFAAETDDSFQDLEVEILSTGCPVLGGALAGLDCAVETVHRAGDHHVIVGRVLDMRAPPGGDPLLYFGGSYARIRR